MAVKWSETLWGLDLTSTQMLVAQALADHADLETRLAWPSQDLLAWKTRLSKRTVHGALKELVRLGVFEVVNKPTWHHSAYYRFNPDHSVPKLPKHKTGRKELPPLGRKLTTSGRKLTALGEEGASTEPSENRQEPSSQSDDREIMEEVLVEGDRVRP